VEVDEGDVELALDPVQDRVRLVERRPRDLELDRPAEVDHGHPGIALGEDRVPPPGVALRIVGGPDDPLLRVEVVVDVAVAVDVVARRDHVRTGLEQRRGRALGYPNAAGGVLAVDYHEVGFVALAQLRHRRGEAPASRSADDVADEEDAHAETLTAVG